jgi:hypothetical protein
VTSTLYIFFSYSICIGLDGTAMWKRQPFLLRKTFTLGCHASCLVDNRFTTALSFQAITHICLPLCILMTRLPLFPGSPLCCPITLGTPRRLAQSVHVAQNPFAMRSWNRRGELKRLSHTIVCHRFSSPRYKDVTTW